MKLSSDRKREIIQDEMSSQRTHITLRGSEAPSSPDRSSRCDCIRVEVKLECLLKLCFHHDPYGLCKFQLIKLK